jgi:uncharacterized coiled-coil protein SlyX
MSTPLEKHLEFHCEQLEKKIEQLEFELATAEQCIGSYREVVSHQQDQIWKNICKDLNWQFIRSL